MSRVAWSRYPGEEIESVISIMLCRKYPNAVRFKPSQGDGGIDVWVPAADMTGAEVYQVKRYTGNIDDTRKRHIRESWQAALTYAKDRPYKITVWHLVTPENPTKEQSRWLIDDVTAGVDFPRYWHGLDYVEALVTEYPEVIDYYFHDGKERLDERVARYLSLASLKHPAESVAASQQTLEELHKSLNDTDPHYRYDFSVDHAGAGGRCPPFTSGPGLVCAFQASDGERCVTYKISARYDLAVEDRPLPVKMTLVGESDQLKDKIEDWIKFGTPIDNVPAKDVRMDLPGGFGGEHERALVTIGPTPPAEPLDVTLRITNEFGELMAELDFRTDQLSSGFQTERLRGTGRDLAAGVIRYELRIDPLDKLITLNFSTGPMVGHPPADLLPCIRFLNSMRPSHKIQLFVKNGPALAPPWDDVPAAMISEDQARLWESVCEDLAAIQQRVYERILFPDLSQTTWAAIEEWSTAAHLLRGERIEGRWDQGQLHLAPGVEPPIFEGPLVNAAFERPYTVTIGDQEYLLGKVIVWVGAMRADEARAPEPHEDHLDVWVVAVGDTKATMQLVDINTSIAEADAANRSVASDREGRGRR